MNISKLDEIVSKKLINVRKKYPRYCAQHLAQYLNEMHEVIDWANKELKKLCPRCEMEALIKKHPKHTC
jgi:hypothetical protein